MRFVIINTDYSTFTRALYGRHASLARASYATQMRVRNESLFGLANFNSKNLRKLGHNAWDVHANSEPMQRAWAAEHGVRLCEQCGRGQGLFPWRRRAAANWLHTALAAQLRHYQPDVVINYNPLLIGGQFLRQVVDSSAMVIGFHAAVIPAGADFGGHDLMLSAAPSFVAYFRSLGFPSRLLHFAFEPETLATLAPPKRRCGVCFAGHLSQEHASRRALLHQISAQFPIDIYCDDPAGVDRDSPIHSRLRDAVWGLDMLRVMGASAITLNNHIDVAGPDAGNMRLFEATGVGTMLLTDWKSNLQELFEPGREVITYRDPQHCTELIRYYAAHSEQRESVAQAGQQRTLSHHTYLHRMREIVEMVQENRSQRRAA